jgi:hypothetical protein
MFINIKGEGCGGGAQVLTYFQMYFQTLPMHVHFVCVCVCVCVCVLHGATLYLKDGRAS